MRINKPRRMKKKEVEENGERGEMRISTKKPRIEKGKKRKRRMEKRN